MSLFCIILDYFSRFQILSQSLSELWRHCSTVFKTSELLMGCDSRSLIQHMFLVLSLSKRNEKKKQRKISALRSLHLCPLDSHSLYKPLKKTKNSLVAFRTFPLAVVKCHKDAHIGVRFFVFFFHCVALCFPLPYCA